jgi:2-dehydropantoate 2-reductase
MSASDKNRHIRPIVVVGAGALGQTYSAALAAVGNQVLLVTTESSRANLVSAGRVVITGMLQLSVPVQTSAVPSGALTLVSPGAVREVEGIIFATKGHQLAEAAKSLGHASVEWVIGIQNGVAKNDVLAAIFGWPKVMGATTMLGGDRRSDGSVEASTLGITSVGELDGRLSSRATWVAARLESAGIPAEARPDIRSLEWAKLINAAAAFAVSILTRAQWMEAFESPHYGRAFLSLVREIGEIATAEGVRIRDYDGMPVATYISAPDEVSIALRAERAQKLRAAGNEQRNHRTSMLQDLLAGRRMEVESVFGDLVERSLRHGIFAPRLQLVLDLARGMDALQPDPISSVVEQNPSRIAPAHI